MTAKEYKDLYDGLCEASSDTQDGNRFDGEFRTDDVNLLMMARHLCFDRYMYLEYFVENPTSGWNKYKYQHAEDKEPA